jgi:hypothetical protein
MRTRYARPAPAAKIAAAARAGQPSLRERIARLERELAELRAEQRAEFLATIRATVPAGVLFSAGELFAQREIEAGLAEALAAAGVRLARQLAKRLRSFERELGLERVGRDEHGIVWTIPDSGGG